MGTTLAGQALGASATTSANVARFERMDCTQLAAEIRGARGGMINPLTMGYQRGYLRDAEQVAASKGCPPV